MPRVALFTSPLVVGLLVSVVKEKNQAKNRTQAEGSIEKAASDRASSRTFVDSLVIFTGAGLLIVVLNPSLAVLIVGLALVTVIGDFWIRYALYLRGA